MPPIYPAPCSSAPLGGLNFMRPHGTLAADIPLTASHIQLSLHTFLGDIQINVKQILTCYPQNASLSARRRAAR